MSETAEHGSAIRVLIVDDHPLARQGLRVFLHSRKDIQVIGEAASGEEAVRLSEQLHPDIALMDMVMPGMDGAATIRGVLRVSPTTRVIALTSFHDQKMVRAAFEAGAVGYLLKDISGKDLVEAIRATRSGRLPLASEAVQALVSLAAQPAEAARDLTTRELQVLAMMAEGLGNAEIAGRLFVSRSTVKAHVSMILSKLGVSTRVEAVSLALREKMVR